MYANKRVLFFCVAKMAKNAKEYSNIIIKDLWLIS